MAAPPPWPPPAAALPRAANWLQRAGAYVIDLVVSCAVFVAVLQALTAVEALDPRMGQPSGPTFLQVVGLLIMLAAPVCVWVLPEALTGRTLGKFVTRCKVVSLATGRPPGMAALGRGLVLMVTLGLWPIGIVNVLSPLWDRRSQALHDKAAGTYVLRG